MSGSFSLLSPSGARQYSELFPRLKVFKKMHLLLSFFLNFLITP